MPDDILDAAQKNPQKTIDDAAKQAESAPLSSTPPATAPSTSQPIDQPSVPQPIPSQLDSKNPPPTLPPTEPAPTLPAEPAPEPMANPSQTEKPQGPSATQAQIMDELTPKKQKMVDEILNAPTVPLPPVTPPVEEQIKTESSKSPAPPKKKGSRVGLMVGLILFIGTLGVGTYFIAQPQRLADLRSLARITDCRDDGCDAGYTCKKSGSSYGCVPSGGGGGGGTTPTPAPLGCGWRNNACSGTCAAGLTCTRGEDYGTCRCAGPGGTPIPTICQSGQTLCTETDKSVCRDLRYDNRNCGTCGKKCDTNAGLTCWESKCVTATGPVDTTCPSGYTSAGSNRDAAEEACEGVCGTRETPTANHVCENGEIIRAGTGTIPNWCYKCTGKPLSPGSSPTPTHRPSPPQCNNIKIYKDGQVVTDLTSLAVNDQITIAVSGGLATKARIRTNGGAWTQTSTKNATNEYTLNFTILPESIVNNKIDIEAEIFGTDGVWH